jgi:hypothetical protein
MHQLHYNDSPFGAVYYAELEMANKFPTAGDQFEFNTTIDLDDEEIF